MIEFSDYDAHKKFGAFTVTIEVTEDSSRADVWHNGLSVNLDCIESGVVLGYSDDEDSIVEAVFDRGLDNDMVKWAYSTNLY
tara:strand:+ start:717 stop:962 length:246 start_codon:yes stop_codon:yes gene_type:complete